jgi:hypothetical protein
VPLLLVLVGALSRDSWRGTPAWVAGGALLSFLFALGSALPLYRAIGGIELFRRLRYPIKFYLLTTLCIALLAGFAVDRLSPRRFRRREIVALSAAALFYLAALALSREGAWLDQIVRPLLSGLAVPADVLLPAIRKTFLVDAVLGLVAAAAVGLLLFLRPRAPATGYLLGFATLLLALPRGLPLFVSAAQKDLARPPELAARTSGPGRLYVSPRLPEFNVLATGTAHPDMAPLVSKLARVQVEELIPGTGLPFGVRYLFDADPDGSYGWYNRLANEALAASDEPQKGRLLRAFGGRWILAEEGEAYAGARAVTGLTVAGRRLVLMELEAPAPELRWAGRERRRSSLSGALELLRSERFDPETDVVLPGKSDGDATRASRAVLRPDAVEADRAAARVEAEGPGFVVFSRTYFPSWKARVDGEPARVLVANSRELAVAVPAGSHRVEFEWDRGPFFQGVVIQGAALALFLAAALAGRRGVVKTRVG